ncbi:MAG: peptidase S10 [Armatimonadetes bacterium]|nr:peptidase S10 [Armatimonadota bacterium]
MGRVPTFLIISALSISFAFAQSEQGPGQRGPGQGRFQRSQQEPPAQSSGEQTKNASIEIPTSVTHHTISLPSGSLKYTATAAQIPLRNDSGEVECRMFYVAYTKDDEDISKRPVTFAFNGGPGSATMWLHMGALGPKRAPMPDDGSLPAAPYTAVDNPDTWLDFTDVVVIDAPGTGYSRLANQSLASKYYGVRQDIQAFTEFVRGWLKEHHRWTSPLFIAGESYGGIRGSGLSASLVNAGIGVNGFISISGTSSYMTIRGMRGNDSPYIGFFPSMAACAWYHHKLAARFKTVDQVLKEAQQFVDTEYVSALERGDSLSDQEKEHIATKMSEFLGISKEYCLGANLSVNVGAFFKELLRKEGLMIGRYDGRLTGREETKVGDRGLGDPSDDATTPPFTSTINDYLDRELGIKTDLTYLNSGRVRPWSEDEGVYSETATDLSHLLLRDPHFHVMYCCGYYDLACPLNATVYTVNHMGLDKETRKQISFQFYPAGHMMYIEKSSRQKLHDDAKAFEKMVLSGG